MGDTILLRRGTAANLPDLQEGEPGFATDNEGFYIGDDTGTAESAAYIGGGVYVDALQYEPNTYTQATIEAALTAIGAVNKVTLLLRPGTWVISANADWSTYKNVTFKIVPGATLQVANGTTTTFGGPIEAGRYLIFSLVGTGAVVMGNGSVIAQYPEWYGGAGDNSTDNTAAFSAIVASTFTPVIEMGTGTYLGVVSATNKQPTIKGQGRQVTILKNNSAASSTITFSLCNYYDVRDLTVDNSSKVSHGLDISTGYYGILKDLFIKNHGNGTSAKYGLFLDATTAPRVDNVLFQDIDDNYGGHLYANVAFGGTFNMIGGGRAGKDILSSRAIYLNNAVGVTFTNTYFDEAGKAGYIYLDTCSGVSFFNTTVELTQQRSANDTAWIMIANASRGISFIGGKMRTSEDIGTVKPYFAIGGANGARGVVIKGFNFDRRVTGGSGVTMIALEAGSTSVDISNISVSNTDFDGTTPIAYVGLNAGANTPDAVTLTGWQPQIGSVTHIMNKATHFIGTNCVGNLTLASVGGNEGTILNNWDGTIVGALEKHTRMGSGALIQDLHTDNTVTLAGATTDLAFSIPSGSYLIGVSANVQTTVTYGGGGTTWAAAFITGSATSIATGQAAAINTKVKKVLNEVTTGGVTDVRFTANAGTFTGGTVKVTVIYRNINNMPDA